MRKLKFNEWVFGCFLKDIIETNSNRERVLQKWCIMTERFVYFTLKSVDLTLSLLKEHYSTGL